MKDDPADQLHVEMTHFQSAQGGFPNSREGLRQEAVKGFSLIQTLPENSRLGFELLIAHRLYFGLKRIDALDKRLHLLQLAFILAAENFSQKIQYHIYYTPAERISS
jgi:hypothetical protein